MRLRGVFFCLFFLLCHLQPLLVFANNRLQSKPNQIIPAISVTPSQNLLIASKDLSMQNKSVSGAPKIILTRDQLLATGVVNLQTALQDLAGVTVQDIVGNGSQTSISMRGFGSNASSNTLVLINGIPITNPDLASANLNTIPLQEIELIEIIAGTESVLYGDQAVGGIVSIMTRQAAKEKVEVNCRSGSYNQFGCYAWLANHKDNIHFYFSPAQNHTDNYRDNNDYDQTLLTGGMHYQFATGQMRFTYSINGENMQFPGALTHSQVVENRRQAQNDTDFFKDWNGFFHLQFTRELFANWHGTLDLARREMHGRGVLYSPFSQSRQIHFLKPQLYKTTPYGQLLLGGDIEDDSYFINSAFGITHEKQQKWGAFSLYKMDLPRQIAVSIGVRAAELTARLNSATTNTIVNRAMATTIGAIWQMIPSVKFYLRRASSYRFPKADENAFAPIGVTSLRTQRGVSYETGTEWNDGNNQAKAGVYVLNLRDEIAFDPTQTPQTPFGANQNLNPTNRYGFTLSGLYHFLSHFTADGQFNYVNARFQNGPNSGKRIPLVAENILRAGLQYIVNDTWRLYVEGVYTGNQYSANDYANIAGRIGGYTVYNFNLQYQLKNLLVTLRIDNAFNKAYYFYTTYRSSANAQFFYPAPLASMMLTVQYAIV